MKLGWDSKTGLNRTCKSWRNQNDPSSGYFTFIIQLDGLPQVIIRGGSVIKNRAGQWYNGRFSGSDPLGDTAVYSTKFEYSADEVTYSYEARSSLFIRFELSSIGDVWDEGKKILASDGCVRSNSQICGNGEGFEAFGSVKLPDSSGQLVNVNKSIEECEVACLENCSCLAYGTMELSTGGYGCVTWFQELIDVRNVLAENGQILYVRVGQVREK
ncbi:hypothetical protein IC582_029448 [Cucumis melo]